MRTAVTGSIATDHLMVYPGRFDGQFPAGRPDRVSLSFLVERLDVRRSGAAADICFGMGVLGLRPVLVGAVGRDFGEHRAWLEDHGVDTASVRVSRNRYTARFLRATDDYDNRIASFYSGAMTEAREIELAPIAARAGPFDLVVIAQNEQAAMVRQTQECRDRGYVFSADPSQSLETMGRADIRSLVSGAACLFTNEEEHDLLLSRTRWTEDQVLAEVGTWITTLGADGARAGSAGGGTTTVPAVRTGTRPDPGGAGHAFRAGFLAGRSWDLGVVRSLRLGCALASLAIESPGTQEYTVDHPVLLTRLARTYEPADAAAIAPHLPVTAMPAGVMGA